MVSCLAFGIPACGSSSDSGGSGGTGGKSGSGGTGGGTGGSSGTGGTAGTDAGTGGSAGSATGGTGGGTAGAAGSAGSANTTCGTASCTSVSTGIPGIDLAACCPTGTTDKCGLNVSLLSAVGVNPPDPCVAKDQPGNLDTSCPVFSVTNPVAVTLPGCCTPSGQCGYMANEVNIPGVADVTLGLGCVDPTSLGFTPEGGLTSCTPGGSDGGGTGGSAGAPADAGGG